MTTMFNDLMAGLEEVDAVLAGQAAGNKVSVSTEVDVKSIRKELKMTQAQFSDTFGFSLDAVKHREGGRLTPEASTRAFLTVIAKNTGAVIEALHPRLPRRRHSNAAKETLTEATPKRRRSTRSARLQRGTFPCIRKGHIWPTQRDEVAIPVICRNDEKDYRDEPERFHIEEVRSIVSKQGRFT